MPFAWSPTDGVLNASQFPTKDPSIRTHLQALLQQIPDYYDPALALKANTTQEAWQAPTLVGGWANYDAVNFMTAKYMKDSLGFVTIMGEIKGTSATTAFTMPAGYRIGSNQNFIGIDNAGLARIYVGSNGAIEPNGSGTATWVSFSIRYKAEN